MRELGLGGGVTSWLAELQHSCRAAAQTEASRLSQPAGLPLEKSEQ